MEVKEFAADAVSAPPVVRLTPRVHEKSSPTDTVSAAPALSKGAARWHKWEQRKRQKARDAAVTNGERPPESSITKLAGREGSPKGRLNGSASFLKLCGALPIYGCTAAEMGLSVLEAVVEEPGSLGNLQERCCEGQARRAVGRKI